MKKGCKRIMAASVACVFITSSFLTPLNAQTGYIRQPIEEVAQKPYMGWSSYSLQVYDNELRKSNPEKYGSMDGTIVGTDPIVDRISAEGLKAQSDAMEAYLQDYGYTWINIDAGWNGDMDAYGRPLPSTVRYPNAGNFTYTVTEYDPVRDMEVIRTVKDGTAGFKELIDYIHAKGQKVGLYLIPGVDKSAVQKNLPIIAGTNPDGTPLYYTDENGNQLGIGDIVAPQLRDDKGRLRFETWKNADGSTVLNKDGNPADYPVYPGMDYWGYTYKIDFDTHPEAAQAYIDSIADLIASWGIDFVKFDSVSPGSGMSVAQSDARGDVAAWSKALKRNNIWFEISWALDHEYADYWKKYADGWRIHWDIEAYNLSGMVNWDTVSRLFPRNALWWREGGQGSWNDFDSLNIGNGNSPGNMYRDGLTDVERQTAMTFWCVSSVPLYLGSDMTRLDAYGLSLLTNTEAIAINQMGNPAQPVSADTPYQVWFSNNGDGTFNVALFNLSGQQAEVGVNWEDIGLDGTASVRDIWNNADYTQVAEGFTANLPAHGSALLKVTAQSGSLLSVNNDDPLIRRVSLTDTDGMDRTDPNWTDYLWQYNAFYQVPKARQDITITLNDGETAGVSVPETAWAEGLVLSEALSAQSFVYGKGLEGPVDPSDDPHSTLINGDDPAITFVGGFNSYGDRKEWGKSDNRLTSSLLYKGDIQYVDAIDAYFEYAFEGVGIEVVLEIMPRTESEKGSSVIDIFLDGELMETMDTSVLASKREVRTVYSAKDLPDSSHTLRVAARDDHYLQLDALKVIPAYQVYINNDDPSIVYTGNNGKVWQRHDSRPVGGHFKGDIHYIDTAGASFEYNFTGTGLALVMEVINTPTLVELFLDGVSQGVRDVSSGMTADREVREVYSVSGLLEGNHMFKLITQDANYVQPDALVVTASALISPADTVPFEKSAPVDVTTQLLYGEGSLVKIENEGQELVRGQDYTVNGYTVAILQEYLAATDRPAGLNHLIFHFGGGDTQTLTIDVIGLFIPNSTLDVKTGEFNKTTSTQDIQTTMTLNGNTLAAIKNGTATLVEDVDYTLSGDTVSIKGEYLSRLPVGTAALVFYFSAGETQTLVITVTDTDKAVSGRFTRVNNDGAGIRYTGYWNYNGGRGTGSYGEDVHFAEINGSAFEYTFKGTGIAYVTEKDPSQGEVAIYLDGEFYGIVNTGLPAGAPRQVQQAVYRISGLEDGVHTLKAVKLNGTYMLLDCLDIELPDLIGAASAVFERDNPGDLTVDLLNSASRFEGITLGATALSEGTDYILSGSTVNLKASFLSQQPGTECVLTFHFGGDYRNDVSAAKVNGDYFEYDFTGSAVKLISHRGPELGEIAVYIDGVYRTTVDASSSERQAGQILFSETGLGSGRHTLKTVKLSGEAMLLDKIVYTAP